MKRKTETEKEVTDAAKEMIDDLFASIILGMRTDKTRDPCEFVTGLVDFLLSKGTDYSGFMITFVRPDGSGDSSLFNVRSAVRAYGDLTSEMISDAVIMHLMHKRGISEVSSDDAPKGSLQ